MKTTFTYGVGMATVSFVVTLLLFLTGMHSTPEKLATAETIGMVVGLAIAIGGLVMVMKARREEFSAEDGFPYGRALGTGTLTSLWSALASGIYTVIYATAINPDWQQIVRETQLAELAEQGLPAEQLAGAERVITIFTHPIVISTMVVFFGFIFGVVISLIVAAFLKRAPERPLPPPPTEA